MNVKRLRFLSDVCSNRVDLSETLCKLSLARGIRHHQLCSFCRHCFERLVGELVSLRKVDGLLRLLRELLLDLWVHLPLGLEFGVEVSSPVLVDTEVEQRTVRINYSDQFWQFWGWIWRNIFRIRFAQNLLFEFDIKLR